jgi:hypothetical protein
MNDYLKIVIIVVVGGPICIWAMRKLLDRIVP